MANETRTPEQARQGRIVLTTPTRRMIFFGGLIAIAAIGVAAALL